nr:hypothetical protein JVH1_6722 [Rhodococcus sp. JVH1]
MIVCWRQYVRIRGTGALRGFPEIGREELFRIFTLTTADAAFVGR